MDWNAEGAGAAPYQLDKPVDGLVLHSDGAIGVYIDGVGLATTLSPDQQLALANLLVDRLRTANAAATEDVRGARVAAAK